MSPLLPAHGPAFRLGVIVLFLLSGAFAMAAEHGVMKVLLAPV